MPRGGKRENSGRKSRKIETSKISAYVKDRELLNELALELDIPVVELLHQILINKDFDTLMTNIKTSETLKEWYKSQD